MVADAADANLPGLVGPGAEAQVDHGLPPVPQKRAAGQGACGLDAGNLSHGSDPVEQPPAGALSGRFDRIGDLDTHSGAPGHWVEVRINETHLAGDHSAVPGSGGDAGRLAHPEPLAVRLVGRELHPHGGEIRRLKEALPFGDVLALVHLFEHHRAIGWNHEIAGQGAGRLILQRIDLPGSQAHLN